MYSVLILWAPESTENKKIVETIARAFDESKITPLVKKAAETSIVDINAADIVVFGAQKSGNGDVPAEYTELVRVFRGVTLAGRTAGFFSMGPEKCSVKLRKALRDTEIAQLDDDPLFADQRDGVPPDVAEWVRKLVTAHQELKYVGE